MVTLQEVLTLQDEHQALAEHAATAVAPALFVDFTIVVLFPWSTGSPPAGVLAPLDFVDNRFDRSQLQDALAQPLPFVILGQFETEEEWAAVERIIPNLYSPRPIYANMVFRPGLQLTKEENNRISAGYRRLLRLGVDDVFVNPDLTTLRTSLRIAQQTNHLDVQRVELLLANEVPEFPADRVERLSTSYRHLLLESIPRALMPYFPAVDDKLSEGPHNVGRYRLIQRLESTSQRVILAVDEEKWTGCVIKVINKDSIMTPGDLEAIYREFRFVASIIQHPHISRCVEMLHSPARLHLVFEVAGNLNLSQLLSRQPGERLPADESLDVFAQTGSAVAYCHSRDVCHRQISLEHIVVRQMAPRRYHCTLVDFNKAMLMREGTTSSTVCGTMPCIPPEVARGRTYVPWRADVWSIGVVLLEMSGGKGSLILFLGCGEVTTPPRLRVVAKQEQEIFSVAGCHALALARMGGVVSDPITARLKLLLQTLPIDRSPMSGALNGLRHDQASIASAT